MTTKQQYIAQARAANPQPQYATVNGQEIQLTNDEYEASLEAWAEMRVAQDNYVTETETARKSAFDKLRALGLSDAEIKALVG